MSRIVRRVCRRDDQEINRKREYTFVYSFGKRDRSKRSKTERLLLGSGGVALCFVVAFLLARLARFPWAVQVLPGNTAEPVSLALLGFGLSAALLYHVVGRKQPAAGPVSAFVLIGLTTLLWQSVVEGERVQARRTIHAVTSSIQSQILERVGTDGFSLIRIAKRWENGGRPRRALWEADATLHIQHYPEIQTLEWVDRSFRARWRVQAPGSEPARDGDFRRDDRRAALEAALRDRSITLSQPVPLRQGGMGFLIFVPVYPNDAFDGFIVGVYRIDRLLRSLPDNLTRGYTLTILGNLASAVPIFQQGSTARAIAEEYGQTVPVRLSSQTWHLRVAPTPETAAQFQSPVPGLILTAGLLTSVLLGALIYSWQRLQAAQAGLEREIEERRAVEESLRRSEARLSEAQRLARLGFWEYDAATDALFCSDEIYRLVHRDPSSGPMTYEYLIERVHAEDRTPYLALIDAAMAQGVPFDTDIRAALEDGSLLWLHAQGRPLRDAAGKPLRLMGTLRDITEQKRYEAELEDLNRYLAGKQSELQQANETLEVLATTDALTGLYNRHVMQNKIEEELDAARRSGTPLSLLLVDVDHFKDFNDTFGHLSGDQVLRTVGEVLLAATRLADFVARFGGEEFVVVLPDTSASRAEEIADGLRQAIADLSWDDRRITVSIGIATTRDGNTTVGAFLAEADIALYAAKASGRNRVTHFEVGSRG